MKYIFIILSFTFIFSCAQIEPKTNYSDRQNNNTTNSVLSWTTYNNSNDALENCWIISCEYKNNLVEKNLNWKFNLPNIDIYKQRFWILVKQYNEKNKLIKSEEFKTFVEDINKEFFWCEWNIYECYNNTSKLSEDEKNYLFYVYIPEIVLETNLEQVWWNQADIETIIQAIKRKDFDSTIEKEYKIVQYKQKVEDLISKIDINSINKQKLIEDNTYFESQILDPKTWLHDKIIQQIYWINIDWEEEGQLDEIASYTNKSFFDLMEKLWFDKQGFINKVIEINWYDKNNDILESIDKDLYNTILSIKNNHNFPDNRYFRNDELYIFKNQDMFDNKQDNEKMLYIRHRVLLLFSLWEEKKLYELTNRLSQYNFKEKFLLTNIFKYSKYIKIDENLHP